MPRFSSSSAVASRPPDGQPSVVAVGAVAVVAVVSLGGLFVPALWDVAREYRTPEFSHGLLVLPLVVWLLWQRRLPIWRCRDAGAPGGLLPVAAGIAVALFGHAANIESLPYLGLPPVLFGLIACALGWPAARLILIPLGLLYLGFPVPNQNYITLSLALQLASSHIGTAILGVFDIPVLLDGNIIDLGHYKLQVAEACSGMRYLLPLITFGVICALLYRGPWIVRVAVVVLTLPITLLLNGTRIALTGLLVEYGDARLAEGFIHFVEGWLIFLVALLCLFAFLWGTTRLAGERKALLDLLDFDRIGGGAPSPPAAEPTIVPSRPLLLAAMLLAAAAVALVPLHDRPLDVPQRPGLVTFPLAFDDYRGELQAVNAASERALQADDHLLVDFTNSDSPVPVNLWVAYYDSLTRNGSHVHSPVACLPGAGWEYVTLEPHDTGLLDAAGRPLRVNRGVIVKHDSRMIVYFWLELRGRRALGHRARWLNFRDALLLNRSDGALVRLVTPIRAGETVAQGDRRLRTFLAAAYGHLQPHMGL